MQAFVLVCAFIAVVTAKSVPESEHHDHHEDHHNIPEGCYWRNFKGDVPRDALPGGVNVHGKATYIGQVLHKDQLLAAKIDPHEKKVYYESGFMEFVAHKNIKVLCTQNPEQFEWVTTNTNTIHDIEKKHLLVEGGYEEGVTIWIGRKQLKDELAVGKVASTKDHTTLNITKDGVCVQHGEFEILSYNPKIEKKKKIHESDEKSTIVINRLGEISGEKPEGTCQKSVVVNVYNK